MNINMVLAICAALIITLAAPVTAWAQGKAAGKAFDAMARQPQISNDLRALLVLSLAFMEALCIFGLLIAFMLLSKIA